MQRRIVLYESWRLNNQRVPQKLLKTIGGRTLAEIAAEKLVACRQFDVTPVVGICHTDQPLIDLANRFGLEVQIRDVRSRDGEGYEDGFHQLPALYKDRFDWICNINLACHPFLKVETLGKLIEATRTAETPFLSVREIRGMLWGHDLEPLQGGNESPNTKLNPSFYVLTNLGGGYPIGIIDNTEAINATLRPFPMQLGLDELLDVDTPDDLLFLQTYARGKACTVN